MSCSRCPSVSTLDSSPHASSSSRRPWARVNGVEFSGLNSSQCTTSCIAQVPRQCILSRIGRNPRFGGDDDESEKCHESKNGAACHDAIRAAPRLSDLRLVPCSTCAAAFAGAESARVKRRHVYDTLCVVRTMSGPAELMSPHL
jgi:hypothetical protein